LATVAETMHEARPIARSALPRLGAALAATVSTRAFQQAALFVAAMLIASGVVLWLMLPA